MHIAECNMCRCMVYCVARMVCYVLRTVRHVPCGAAPRGVLATARPRCCSLWARAHTHERVRVRAHARVRARVRARECVCERTAQSLV